MFIQTQETPNPNALKFLPGKDVSPTQTIFCDGIEEAGKSPLAGELFKTEGIDTIFFGSDFITITKEPEQDWQVLKPSILSTIMEFFVAGKEVVVNTTTKERPKKEIKKEDEEIVKQIQELLETRVRPAVAMDGGDIVFHGFNNGIVELEMMGACSGCPSSTATLKDGVENMLKHYVPEVQEVIAV